MLTILKNEDFKEEIKTGKVLVDFYAEWCGPCKMMGPILEELSKSNLDFKIIKVNVDEHQALAQEYGVMSIPTLILFDNGIIIKKNVGFVPKELLETWIK
ncbi:MAG: thioredoxin [Bacilli bacterium]